MTRRVVFRPQARRDFDEIADYIAQDNLDRALGFINELEQACLKLADFPHSGRDCSRLLPDLRSAAHKNYVIYYFVLDTGQGIEVVHILHGARRHEQMMLEENSGGDASPLSDG